METLEKAHKYLKVTIDMRRDFIIQARQSADKGLVFLGQVITISGVIAGFGFTAINSIQCKLLFISGELFLFINICLGLFFLNKFWYEDFEIFMNDIKKMKTIHDKLAEGLEYKKEDILKEGIVELENFAKQDRNSGKLFKILPRLMILLIFASSFLILLSI